MKKTLCLASLVSFFCLCACQTKSVGANPKSSPAQSPAETPAQALNEVGNSEKGRMDGCAQKGSDLNFNDQRIVYFQKLVQLQILRIKAAPMTQESTQDLGQLESLRRRVSYPLLTSSLRPQVVTKILTREAKSFSGYLNQRRAQDPQAQSLFDEINGQFLPVIENESHWNCLERPTDFQEESNQGN